MALSFLTAILLAGGVCADGCPAKAECASTAGAASACICEPNCPFGAAACCETAAQDRYVLSFGASWCGPCQQAAPLMKKLAARGFVVRHVDIDHDRKLAARYHIESIPTFVAVVNGCEADRLVGVPTEDRLIRLAKTGRPHFAAHMARPMMPGAKDVQPLIRATYELPPSKAKALTSFLKEMAGEQVETRVEGRDLIVTATPEAQGAIGQFIAVLVKRGEPMQAVSTGECAGAACRLKNVAADPCDKACPTKGAAKKLKFTKIDEVKKSAEEPRLKYWTVEPPAVFDGNGIRIDVPGLDAKECQAANNAADKSEPSSAPACEGRLQISVGEPANRHRLILAANRYFIEQLKRKACELQQKIEALESEAKAEADAESDLPE